VVGPDGLFVRRKGTVLVLKHSTSGENDRIDRQVLDVTGVGQSNVPGQAAMEYALPGHVSGAISIMGKAVVAQLPYTVGPVGMIVTPEGDEIQLIGKVINTNIDGRHQVAMENPLRPGQWSVAEDGLGQQTGFVFRGPASMGATANPETGDQLVSWTPEDGGPTYTLSFDRKTAAYEIIQKDPDPDQLAQTLGQKPTEPFVIGSLASSKDLRDQIGQDFARDLTSVPLEQRNAAQQNGVHLGLSAPQYSAWLQADNQRRFNQARAYGIARRVNVMPYDPLSSIKQIPTTAPAATPVTGTSVPADVTAAAAERAKQQSQAAAATPAPKPADTTTPVAPIAKPVPQTAKDVATMKNKLGGTYDTYDPTASTTTTPVTSTPIVQPVVTQGRTTYLGGGR
jgi:hypothetical protein